MSKILGRCEYSDAEVKLLSHFFDISSYIDRQSFVSPYFLYNIAEHNAFVHPLAYDEYYISALKEVLVAMDNKSCRQTKEIDELIMSFIGEKN